MAWGRGRRVGVGLGRRAPAGLGGGGGSVSRRGRAAGAWAWPGSAGRPSSAAVDLKKHFSRQTKIIKTNQNIIIDLHKNINKLNGIWINECTEKMLWFSAFYYISLDLNKLNVNLKTVHHFVFSLRFGKSNPSNYTCHSLRTSQKVLPYI